MGKDKKTRLSDQIPSKEGDIIGQKVGQTVVQGLVLFMSYHSHTGAETCLLLS